MSAAGSEIGKATDRFAAFLAELSRQVDGQTEEALLEGVSASLRELVSNDDWLDAEFAQPDPDHYRQYLLHADARQRFSVVSFVWGPNQATPIHNHTVWGAVGMLRGAEISEAFELRDGKPVYLGQDRLEPGSVALVSPAIGDIHRVRNAFADRTSISIHVYGGNIGEISRSVYELDGSVKSFISGYSNASLPNERKIG
jgi:predicted metal-dependent enzyme (double-stranded beta helix superfamily)